MVFSGMEGSTDQEIVITEKVISINSRRKGAMREHKGQSRR